MSAPRAACPLCGHSITIRLDGRLRTHGATAARLAEGGNVCQGSWTKATEPRALPSLRSTCAKCGGEYATRADGRVRWHSPNGQGTPRCSGSQQLPAGAR